MLSASVGLGLSAGPADTARPAASAEDEAIAFDPPSQTYRAKPGEESVTLRFRVVNRSAEEMVIKEVNTSCGCTVPRMPSQPWVLAPGASGPLDLTIDLRGKTGTLAKTATVETRRGSRTLTFQIVLPELPAGSTQRERERQLATANRQAIFAGDCVRCHVAPAAGKKGEAFYQTACGICHEAEDRASMVPDLARLNHPADLDYWKMMIATGKVGTLMPGFSTDLGGPLSREEIDALAAYLQKKFPPPPTSAN